MAGKRIRGQEVSIALVQDGVTLDTLTAIKSFEFTYQQEIKNEAYLGETSERVDSIYKAIKGQLEFHTSDNAAFKLAEALVSKAQRRTPGMRINIKCTFAYANGDRVKATLPDVEFGDIPFNVANRSDYVSTRLDFACSEAILVF
jgi:hypothetical protein